MAQGHTVQESRLESNALSPISEDQRHILQQYEKIVRFSDTIFSGKHPKIKPPSSIATAQPSISPLKPATDAAVGPGGISSEQRSSAINGQRTSLNASSAHPTGPNGTSTTSKPFGSGNTEINPILLEKSDDLIKAEIQLQRQRLERALKEELEQRRAARNAAQGEPVVDFDLSDVLAKALTLVQATAAPVPVDETVIAANQDAASDSFDDNTFYSSRHDTPESNLTSRVPNETEETRAPVIANVQQASNDQADTQNAKHRENFPSGNSDMNNTSWQTYPNAPSNCVNPPSGTVSYGGQVPGLNNYTKDKVDSSGLGQDASGVQVQSEGSANNFRNQQAVRQVKDPRRQISYADQQPPSPLVRAHDLSPVAPQPAHVSSLALASRLPAAVEPASIQPSGTPAQVAALRNEPTVITSPDSSPSGGRVPEKKRPKKKKRKADRQVPEAEEAPYIKPEPRSPSPLNAPSYIRPNKRQRYSPRPGDESPYDGPTYDEPGTSRPEDYVRSGRRIPTGYERTGIHPPRSTSVVVATSQPPYGREYIDDRRLAGETYVVQRPSNYGNPEEVVWRNNDVEHDPRIQRRVIDPYAHSPQSHRGAYETPRMSMRPEAERYIEVPTRQAPTRIVVDAFGREYIEPSRPSIIRQSAAPVRPDEPEIIYERTVPRAVTRHVGVESYGEGGHVYQGPSPSYAMPRRIATQPEYASQDYRASRQREYSARPVGPSGEFVEVMAPPERRRLAEPPRDYIARAGSVRPPEPLRYEVPYDYGRVQSVRPEVPVRQYATSIHPESRREVAQPYVRDYGVRTVEQPAVRQEYSVRPMEPYYEQPVRGGDDIAFIERPRGATQEIVYADDARREVYR